MFSPATATIPYAFENSDAFVHLIVFLLCGLSVYVWVTIVEKALYLWWLKKQNRRFLQAFYTISDVRHLDKVVAEKECVLANIAACGFKDTSDSQDNVPSVREADANTRPYENSSGMDPAAVRRRMEREVSRQVDKLEKGLQLLGTTVTISPFLGLLGTVWGVMNAFTGMAQAGQPDIQAMAPGVSGALLTTVVGLVVAIPAVFGYNLLTHAVKKHVNQLDDFVDDCMSLLPGNNRND